MHRPKAKPALVSIVLRVACACALVLACRAKPAPPRPPAEEASAPSASSARAPKWLEDAGGRATADAAPPVPFDAGASACRVVFGPVELPLTGPMALVHDDKRVIAVLHKNGVASAFTFAADAHTPGKKALPADPDRGSKPACAAAAGFAFCSDAEGNVHRSDLATGASSVVAKADLGAQVAAAAVGPKGSRHVVLGYLAVRRTSEGRTSEGFVKLGDGPAVKVSEDGAGATAIAMAEIPGATADERRALVLLVDARRAMSPLHARVLEVHGGKSDEKLDVGPDAVVYVGGGADHQVYAALTTDARGEALALLPTSEAGFGLVAVELAVPPRMDAPFTFSPYPNGINAPPIAGTAGAASMYVARVRPAGPEVGSTRVLELGRFERTNDGSRAFASLGFVGAAGSVSSVAVDVDASGALWVAYTDADGSWIERRQCPP